MEKVGSLSLKKHKNPAVPVQNNANNNQKSARPNRNNTNNNQNNNQNNNKKGWNTPIFTKLAKKYEEFSSKPPE